MPNDTKKPARSRKPKAAEVNASLKRLLCDAYAERNRAQAERDEARAEAARARDIVDAVACWTPPGTTKIDGVKASLAERAFVAGLVATVAFKLLPYSALLEVDRYAVEMLRRFRAGELKDVKCWRDDDDDHTAAGPVRRRT